MDFELDHLFVLTSAGAPEAKELIAFGLKEGGANTHPGQGTACRRFFFHNAYLELLWVADAAEVQSEVIRHTCLWERWSGRASGSCPFGIVFRPRNDPAAKPPFTTWEYHPPYLPTHLSIGVGTNAQACAEPLLFCMPGALRPQWQPVDKRQPLDHPAGLREVSRAEFFCPRTAPTTPALSAAINAGMVRMHEASDFFVEIGFDGETAKQQADFPPALPLVLRW